MLKTFQDLLFSETAVFNKENHAADLQVRAELIMDIVASVNYYEWLVDLIGKLITKEKEKKQKTIYTICNEICACLIEQLLNIEDQRTKPQQTTAATTTKLLHCIITLHIFCVACPTLLITHVTTLQPYLKTTVHDEIE